VNLGWIREDFLGVNGEPPRGTTPIDQRAKYFGHFDSRIRRDAAYSLMPEGAKAMPYILAALDSRDIRVIRAGCDALAAMAGRGHNVEVLAIGERAGKALLPAARTTVQQDRARTLKAGEKYTVRPEPAESNGDPAGLKQGLVAYWSFDEHDGFTIEDHVGHADGRLVGNPQRIGGVRGRCVQLTGAQHVRVPDYRDVLGPSGHIENLTVSYWYRTNYFGCGRIGKGIGQEVERQPANWYYSTTANVAGWDLTCRGTQGGVFLTAGFDGGTKGFKFNGGPGNVVSDGFEWHHVVAVYDGSRKAFEIYIDGVKAPKGGKQRKNEPCAQLDKPFWGVQDENHILPARQAILMIGNLPRVLSCQLSASSPAARCRGISTMPMPIPSP